MNRKRKVLLGAAAAALVVVPVTADRVAAQVVEHTVASRLQCSAGLTEAPDVSIGGFPALTQLAARRWDEVRVTAADVTAGRATLQRVAIEARDLALSGGGISARAVAADLTVAWSALANLGSVPGAGGGEGGDAAGVMAMRVVGGDAAGRMVLQADVSMRGLSLPATVYAGLAFDGGTLTITPDEVELSGLGLRVPAARLPEAAREGRSVELPELPAGLAYREISAAPDGLRVTVGGTNLTGSALGGGAARTGGCGRAA